MSAVPSGAPLPEAGGPSLLKYRVLLVVLIHAGLTTVAWWLSWYLRLEGALLDPSLTKGVDYSARLWELFPWILAARLAGFLYFELFQGLWRYVSITDLVNLLKAVIVGSLLFLPALALTGLENVPRMVLVIEPILCIVLVGGVRFMIRMYREVFSPAVRGGRRALIVGAGDAGEMLLREMRTNRHLGFEPVAFLDDDVRKWGRKIHGVPVVGGIDRVRRSVQALGVEEIIIAVPSASADEYVNILDQCASTGVRLRRLPSRMSDIVRLTQVRDVRVDDLLDREAAELDHEMLKRSFGGKVILVTGAGGSIGSEVVRQLAVLKPKLLIALDRSENSLFFLERELAVNFPGLAKRIRIADCQDRATMRAVFSEARPDFVVHAAAYKHVPLMEAHPIAAVRNNVAATLSLAELSLEYGVAKFLLISSDKAVRPTSMMGTTKRAAELALQSLPRNGTKFLAVRFGNVLGSQGSVVPLFKKQIQAGGPVTVTHEDVVRYFMTIAEAVGLVLEASCMGEGGEIFHLDMGRPVRVMELAERLIQLSGFRPHEDIEIQVVGLRPGEKMHEELLADGEDVVPTEHERIRVLRPHDINPTEVRRRVDDLLEAASVGRGAVVRSIKVLVPEYQPNNEEFGRILAEGEPVPRTRPAPGR